MCLNFANKTKPLRVLLEIIFQNIRWSSSPYSKIYNLNLAVNRILSDNKKCDQGKNHFSYSCLLRLWSKMFVSHHYQVTSTVPTAHSSYTLKITIKRGWIINGQYFPVSYLLPQYDVYSAEMWIWDALYTLSVCEMRSEITYLEVSASCADLSGFPDQLNNFSTFSHTTFRKAHANSTPPLHCPSSYSGLTLGFNKKVLRNPAYLSLNALILTFACCYPEIFIILLSLSSNFCCKSFSC